LVDIKNLADFPRQKKFAIIFGGQLLFDACSREMSKQSLFEKKTWKCHFGLVYPFINFIEQYSVIRLAPRVHQLNNMQTFKLPVDYCKIFRLLCVKPTLSTTKTTNH
jgi:hypothetical protein